MSTTTEAEAITLGEPYVGMLREFLADDAELSERLSAAAAEGLVGAELADERIKVAYRIVAVLRLAVERTSGQPA